MPIPVESTQFSGANRTPGTVVVVGSINVDLVLRVDRLPAPGETVTGGTFEQNGGGKGANQAVAAARAGAEVRLVGAVGDDEMGARALAELCDEGIDVTSVVRLTDAPTGLAVVVVDAEGENQIAVASGANAHLDDVTVHEILAREIMPADGVCLLNFEIPDAPIVAAARCAHAAGMRAIVLNPAPARALPSGVLELGPILTPNAGEAVALGDGDDLGGGGEDAEAAAMQLSAMTRGQPVIVTLGANGALMVTGRQQLRRFAAPSVRAVDATGAGDAFNGAFAAALAQGYELPQAVNRAVAAGSYSVQAKGARGGMATAEEIDKLLGRAGG